MQLTTGSVIGEIMLSIFNLLFMYLLYVNPNGEGYQTIIPTYTYTITTVYTACHFPKWVKSKDKSENGFPGQRTLLCHFEW